MTDTQRLDWILEQINAHGLNGLNELAPGLGEPRATRADIDRLAIIAVRQALQEAALRWEEAQSQLREIEACRAKVKQLEKQLSEWEQNQ